jgi:hypothetical protein
MVPTQNGVWPCLPNLLFASTTNECIFFLYSKPESGKRWKDVNCGSTSMGKAYIQASFKVIFLKPIILAPDTIYYY